MVAAGERRACKSAPADAKVQRISYITFLYPNDRIEIDGNLRGYCWNL